MNRQICNCIKYLIKKNGNWVAVETLSHVFEVSERTIRNYAEDIEAFFVRHNMEHEFIITNSQLKVVCSQQDIQRICQLITESDFYDYRLNVEERQDILLLIFLAAETPYTLKELEQILYISRNTLMGDITEIKKQLDEQGIHFSEKKQLGFVVNCPESVRRDMLLALHEKIGKDAWFLDHTILCDIRAGFANNLLKRNLYETSVAAAIHKVENDTDFIISDFDYYHLMDALCVLMYRTAQTHYIEDNYMCDLSQQSFVGNNASDLLTQLLGAHFPQSEVNYLAHRLDICSPLFVQNKARQEYANYSIIVKSFLCLISETFQTDLTQDAHLQAELENHLFRVQQRVNDGQDIINPYKDSVISEYAGEYEKLSRHISSLEQELQQTFSVDEITYILVYVLAAMERKKERTNKPTVIVACNTGLGMANFLAEQIKKHFHLNIRDVTSSHNVAERIGKYPYDLIITTVPLENILVPWVQVDPVLNKDDIRNIRLALSGLFVKTSADTQQQGLPSHDSAPNAEDGRKRLSDLLSPSDILLDVPADNWEEAILMAGRPLYEAGKVTEGYLTAMVENVAQNGPYIVFVKGVAVAHAAAKDGVRQVGATVARLETPVEFGHATNDPVLFVVTLALDLSLTNRQFFMEALNLLSSPEFFDTLSELRDADEVLTCIKRLEEKLDNV